MFPSIVRPAAALVAAFSLLSLPVVAQSGAPLIQATSAQPIPGADANPAASRARLVAVDTLALHQLLSNGAPSQPVSLQLFPDLDVQVQHESTELAYGGGLIWTGSLVGHANSSIVLSLVGDAVAASVRFDDRLYSITYAGNDAHWVARIDESAMPVCGTGDEHHVQSPTAPTAPSGGTSPSVAPRAAGSPDIDVLVAYTTAAKNGNGGTSGIAALINLAVAETNQGYQDSLVDQRLVLVHTEEMVGYNEPSSMGTMLSDLRGTNDGKMDQVHALRDQYGADCVSLINQNGGYCGIGYLMGNVSAGFESSAFTVTKASCATGYYSFGHELGHNMGSTHDPGNGSGAAYNYGYGYRTPNSAYRTVMAYSPGTRVDRYSNPNTTYAGFVMGAALQDNARSLNNTASTVAAWRGTASSAPVLTPPVLVSGFPSVLNCSDCTSGGTVFFAYSLNGGGPSVTPYGTAQLSAPFVTLPSVSAAPDGTAAIVVSIPPSATGVTVWLQALDLSTSELSNGVSTTIL